MSAGPFFIKCLEKAKCEIGDNVFFNHNCSITCADSIKIDDSCNIANNVVIVDSSHKIGENGLEKEFLSAPVIIGKMSG